MQLVHYHLHTLAVRWTLEHRNCLTRFRPSAGASSFQIWKTDSDFYPPRHSPSFLVAHRSLQSYQLRCRQSPEYFSPLSSMLYVLLTGASSGPWMAWPSSSSCHHSRRHFHRLSLIQWPNGFALGCPFRLFFLLKLYLNHWLYPLTKVSHFQFLRPF